MINLNHILKGGIHLTLMLDNLLKNFDPRIIFIFSILILSAFGLVMVFSSSSVFAMENHADAYFYLKKQAIYLVLGLIAFSVSSNFIISWVF